MDIQKSIVAILDKKKKIIGTGFVAGENLILTCAHVIETATSTVVDPATDLNVQVTIRFAIDGSEVVAQVDTQNSSPGYEKDVALLRVDALPQGAKPLPLAPAAGSAGHDFYAYGYATVTNIQGIGARGKIVDIVDNGRLVQLTSQEPDYGMSGAPVLDEQRRVVIGMVTKGKNKPDENGSYKNISTTFAITTELICEVCPLIEITLSDFSEDQTQTINQNVIIGENAENNIIITGDHNQVHQVRVQLPLDAIDGLQDEVKTRSDGLAKHLSGLAAQQRIWFIGVLLAIVAVGSGVVWMLIPKESHNPMTGDFRIAVASFYENGNSGQEKLGYDLADSVRLRLEQDLKDINPQLVITIWGPDRVGAVSGKTTEERAIAAQKIADQIHADMVIYGVVDIDGDEWQVLPEFYISAENFYEAREIVGQNDMGTPFNLPGSSNSAWRFEFGKQMFARGKALSVMSVGLGYFALHQYEKSLETFQSGLNIANWTDNEGKKVLYIMTGFAAGKVGQNFLNQKEIEKALSNFDTAQEMLDKALVIDPTYARPYIGIANLNYMRALIPFSQSKNYRDIDNALLDKCLAYLDQAQAVKNKPPLAEVETKIHFSRGQCLTGKILSRTTTTAKPAFDELQWVVQAYGDGKNPHVRELAAEAHARLGLIYRELKKNDQALVEYQLAVDLLSDYPDRQAVFKKAVATLSAGLTPTP